MAPAAAPAATPAPRTDPRTDPVGPADDAPPDETVDVVIVGAGLSGVSAAVHLRRHCPRTRFVMLEARDRVGGTWDLFRYPGVRSDSDMHTLGFAFRPWTEARALADGPSIRRYIADTVREHGLEPTLRHGHRVQRADWTSADARWTLTVATPTGERRIRCRVLDVCSGYYRYDQGHRPRWPGEDAFTGRIVHPQHWPDDLDHRGRRVAVIGSGATAVTLVPAMAADAAHVTMVQRSPSYVMSLPAVDGVAVTARRFLPARLAYRVVRAKNVLLGSFFFRLSRRRPQAMGRWLIRQVAQALPPGYDVGRHFTPRYAPWDQRLCLVPDGDLFAAIRSGRASVATGQVVAFTPQGLRLDTGEEVAADVVVTATGLELQLLGGVALTVDGRAVDPSRALLYKSLMVADVPNLVLTFGYTNASWTLKADLTARWLCRLVDALDRRGARVAVAPRDPAVGERPFLDFSSGYVTRAADRLPKQGDRGPWRAHQNYLRDLWVLRFGRLDDGTLRFER
mgnify:CR=1 FL=1